MKFSYKWKIGLLWGSIFIVPLSVLIWMRMSYVHSYLKTQNEGKQIIAQFHQRFNAGDFDAICRDAQACEGPMDIPGNWRADLEGVRNRFGRFQVTRRSQIAIYLNPITVQGELDSSFEQGRINERFVMREIDGRLELAAYYATPNPEAVHPMQHKE